MDTLRDRAVSSLQQLFSDAESSTRPARELASYEESVTACFDFFVALVWQGTDKGFRPLTKALPQILQVALTDSLSLTEAFELTKESSQGSRRCLKIFAPGERVFHCRTCQVDDTCVQCAECFMNSNHEGHEYVMTSSGGGCCDCGDSDAWAVDGFCSKHRGAADSRWAEGGLVAVEALPPRPRALLPAVIDSALRTMLHLSRASFFEKRLGTIDLEGVWEVMGSFLCRVCDLGIGATGAVAAALASPEKFAHNLGISAEAGVPQAWAIRTSVPVEVQSLENKLRTQEPLSALLELIVLECSWKPLPRIHMLYYQVLGDAVFRAGVVRELSRSYDLVHKATRAQKALSADGERETAEDTLQEFFGVQVLTVPSLVPLFQEYGVLSQVLLCTNCLLVEASRSNRALFEPFSATLDFTHEALQTASFARPLSDLHYLTSHPGMTEYAFGSPSTHALILDLLARTTYMYPVKRLLSEHIEFESFTWAEAFSLAAELVVFLRDLAAPQFLGAASDATALPGSKRSAAALSNADHRHVEASPFALAVKKLAETAGNAREFVSDDLTAIFYHPLHWLVGWALTHAPDSEVARIASESDLYDGLVSAAGDTVQLHRVLWEDMAGLWVRNGREVTAQCRQLTSPYLREFAILTNQSVLSLAITVCGADRMVAEIVDRCGLGNEIKALALGGDDDDNGDVEDGDGEDGAHAPASAIPRLSRSASGALRWLRRRARSFSSSARDSSGGSDESGGDEIEKREVSARLSACLSILGTAALEPLRPLAIDEETRARREMVHILAGEDLKRSTVLERMSHKLSRLPEEVLDRLFDRVAARTSGSAKFSLSKDAAREFDVFYPLLEPWNRANALARVEALGGAENVLAGTLAHVATAASDAQPRCEILATQTVALLLYSVFARAALDLKSDAKAASETSSGVDVSSPTLSAAADALPSGSASGPVLRDASCLLAVAATVPNGRKHYENTIALALTVYKSGRCPSEASAVLAAALRSAGALSSASPSNATASADAERERRRKIARERQRALMEQFSRQQAAFSSTPGACMDDDGGPGADTDGATKQREDPARGLSCSPPGQYAPRDTDASAPATRMSDSDVEADELEQPSCPICRERVGGDAVLFAHCLAPLMLAQGASAPRSPHSSAARDASDASSISLGESDSDEPDDDAEGGESGLDESDGSGADGAAEEVLDGGGGGAVAADDDDDEDDDDHDDDDDDDDVIVETDDDIEIVDDESGVDDIENDDDDILEEDVEFMFDVDPARDNADGDGDGEGEAAVDPLDLMDRVVVGDDGQIFVRGTNREFSALMRALNGPHLADLVRAIRGSRTSPGALRWSDSAEALLHSAGDGGSTLLHSCGHIAHRACLPTASARVDKKCPVCRGIYNLLLPTHSDLTVVSDALQRSFGSSTCDAIAFAVSALETMCAVRGFRVAAEVSGILADAQQPLTGATDQWPPNRAPLAPASALPEAIRRAHEALQALSGDSALCTVLRALRGYGAHAVDAAAAEWRSAIADPRANPSLVLCAACILNLDGAAETRAGFVSVRDRELARVASAAARSLSTFTSESSSAGAERTRRSLPRRLEAELAAAFFGAPARRASNRNATPADRDALAVSWTYAAAERFLWTACVLETLFFGASSPGTAHEALLARADDAAAALSARLAQSTAAIDAAEPSDADAPLADFALMRWQSTGMIAAALCALPADRVPGAPVEAEEAAEEATGSAARVPLPFFPAITFAILPHAYEDVLRVCGACERATAISLRTGKVCRGLRRRGLVEFTKKHANGYDVFFDTRRTTCLIVAGDRSAGTRALYLDAHGEEDVNVRRGRPLFLSEERYTALRRDFVSGALISRCDDRMPVVMTLTGGNL